MCGQHRPHLWVFEYRCGPRWFANQCTAAWYRALALSRCGAVVACQTSARNYQASRAATYTIRAPLHAQYSHIHATCTHRHTKHTHTHTLTYHSQAHTHSRTHPHRGAHAYIMHQPSRTHTSARAMRCSAVLVRGFVTGVGLGRGGGSGGGLWQEWRGTYFGPCGGWPMSHQSRFTGPPLTWRMVCQRVRDCQASWSTVYSGHIHHSYPRATPQHLPAAHIHTPTHRHIHRT